MKNKTMKSVFAFVALVSLLTACGNDNAVSDNVVNNNGVNSGDVNSGDEFYGSFVDARDGQQYKTVKIGNQVWMAQNLNYATKNSLCYNSNLSYCSIYGQFYTWDEALTACPQGWHLPSKAELNLLIEYAKLRVEQIVTQKKLDMVPVLDGEDEWLNHLRDASWDNGINTFGFSALPVGGYRYESEEPSFYENTAFFWYLTEGSSYSAFYLDNHGNGGFDDNYGIKPDGSSVRCLKD